MIPGIETKVVFQLSLERESATAVLDRDELAQI